MKGILGPPKQRGSIQTQARNDTFRRFLSFAAARCEIKGGGYAGACGPACIRASVHRKGCDRACVLATPDQRRRRSFRPRKRREKRKSKRKKAPKGRDEEASDVQPQPPTGLASGCPASGLTASGVTSGCAAFGSRPGRGVARFPVFRRSW